MSTSRDDLGPGSSLRKSWFVFIGDYHRGPFSGEDIFQQLNEGMLSADDLIWADGMPDWRPIREVPYFGYRARASVSQRTPARSTVARPAAARDEVVVSGPPVPTTSRAVEIGHAKTGSKRWSRAIGATIASLAVAAAIGTSTETGRALLGVGVRVPELADVARDEHDLLKAAAARSPWREGTALAIAISKVNSLTPTLYVTSNRANATVEVIVEGVPGTLIGRPRVFRRVEVRLEKGFAKTPPIRLADGSTLPRGEYRVYALDRATGPVIAGEADLRRAVQLRVATKAGAAGALARRGYFLGGARDAAYDRALTAYHDNLRAEAKLELQELGQIAATLESQLANSTATFEAAVTSPVAAARWDAFAKRWAGPQSQLKEAFDVWHESVVREQFFHSELYLETKRIGLAVERVHRAQGETLARPAAERANFDAVISDARSARDALAALRVQLRSAATVSAPTVGTSAR